jgi:hypothetical protein
MLDMPATWSEGSPSVQCWFAKQTKGGHSLLWEISCHVTVFPLCLRKEQSTTLQSFKLERKARQWENSTVRSTIDRL